MNGAGHSTACEGVLNLASYSVSGRTGFLPETPCVLRLCDYYEPWERLVEILHVLISEKKIRDEVICLPLLEVSDDHLQTEDDWWRAYVVLTFLSQAYIWVDGDTNLPSSVPECLAVPWWEVSLHFDMPPVITYACTTIHNWALRDPVKGLTADNFYSTVTFTGTRDEEWFYVVPLLVEMAAAPGLQAMVDAFQAMLDEDNPMLLRCMNQIETAILEMKAEFNRMPDECDPHVFYNDIRPFQAGSKGLDSLPNGLVYEGIDPKPMMFSGASAAQSSSLPAYDIFLGVEHTGADREFLEQQKLHMPPSHREFLKELAHQPSVRDYISHSGNSDLVRSYNRALANLADFRTNHVIVVTRYIVLHARKGSGQNESLETKGTGGTDFMQFLKQVRDDVKKLMLPENKGK